MLPKVSSSKRGAPRRNIYTDVLRVSVTTQFSHLIPFLKGLKLLGRGERNAVLLRALDRGAFPATEKCIAPAENEAVAQAIDQLLDSFG